MPTAIPHQPGPQPDITLLVQGLTQATTELSKFANLGLVGQYTALANEMRQVQDMLQRIQDTQNEMKDKQHEVEQLIETYHRQAQDETQQTQAQLDQLRTDIHTNRQARSVTPTDISCVIC